MANSQTISLLFIFILSWQLQLFSTKSNAQSCDNSTWISKIPLGYNPKTKITVDLGGCGMFNSIQQAIDNIQPMNPNVTLVMINSGTYREKVHLYDNRTNVIFEGKGSSTTLIVWNDTANSTGKTYNSWSVGLFGPNFTAFDISFKNSAPYARPGVEGGQAVAVRVAGDQSAFYNCGFYSGQDTLHDDRGKHFFDSCFIEGSIDFIFGDARSFYKNCTINSVADTTAGGVTGIITAQGKYSSDDKTGFAFFNCIIQGTGRIWLGRAWKNFSSVVFAQTYMPDIILPTGWDNGGNPSWNGNVFFGEFNCTGKGVFSTKRVQYSKNLTASEAMPFLNETYIDGEKWLRH